MPYDLVQASPKRWFVVNTETGKRHSEKPLGMKKAKTQLRILNKAKKIEGGSEDPRTQYQQYLAEHPWLSDLPSAKDTAEEAAAKRNMPGFKEKKEADEKLLYSYNVPASLLQGQQTYYHQFHGGDLPNTTAEIPALSRQAQFRQQVQQARGQAISQEQNVTPNEKPVYDATIKAYETNLLNLWEPGLTDGQLLSYISSGNSDASGKAKAIIYLRKKYPTNGFPDYDYGEEQRLYVVKFNFWRTQPIFVFNQNANPDNALIVRLNDPKPPFKPDLTFRSSSRAILDLRKALVAPNFNYKQALANLDKERIAYWDSVQKSSYEYKMQQYQKGYDEAASAINQYGADYLWHSINLDSMPDDTDFDKGRRYAVIQYRSVWDVPPPKKSWWEEAWDAVSTGVEIGLKVAEIAL